MNLDQTQAPVKKKGPPTELVSGNPGLLAPEVESILGEIDNEITANKKAEENAKLAQDKKERHRKLREEQIEREKKACKCG